MKMKASGAFLALLIAGVYGGSVRETLDTIDLDDNTEDRTLLPQNNYDGWVNPEDFAPMPQCVAQQDQSTWLETMTKCTGKRCTRHFGFICTHHQWLSHLSCLSQEFSSEVVDNYISYCGRSILAKAQLYQWIHNITGRTWLVDVGDANDVQTLSPASLVAGYGTWGVIDNAPKCLTSAVSAGSPEPFQHVMASCSFTGTTEHTGNAARPWEYSEAEKSMITLDSETVGYNLVGRHIGDGEYFDRDCFCNTFSLDVNKEPCSGSGELDFTRERFWIKATCGSTSLPDNWTDTLKTTEFAYIPIEDWRWPMCVADMPKQVLELPDQCVTDACEVNSSGYCEIRRAVDRACFCRDISYDTCQGLCQVFETRINYVKWLHNLCGNVENWHGLPDNWRELAAPTPVEMIPWRWTIKPPVDSDIPNIPGSGPMEMCPSNDWKLRSFALVNLTTFIVALLNQKINQLARGFSRHSKPWCWFLKGTAIAFLNILGNLFNIFFVQNTSGYEDVPSLQLIVLWCSIPRLAWLMILIVGLQNPKAMNLCAVQSLLFAEGILQLISSYYMIITVNYGLEHNFYFRGLEVMQRGKGARTMYYGALLWVIIVVMTAVQVIRSTRTTNSLTGSPSLDPRRRRKNRDTISKILGEQVIPFTGRLTKPGRKLRHSWIDSGRSVENRPLLKSGAGGDNTGYRTFHGDAQYSRVPRKAFQELFATAVGSTLFLWIAQWLFWGGFTSLGSEVFCLPKLGVLTAVRVAFSLAGALIAYV